MSNDISIRVSNETLARNLYIVIFQKPENANPNMIFTSLFPVAWEVLALGPSQTCRPIIYPVQLEMMVTESEDARNAQSRETFQNVDMGDVWSFTRNGDFSSMALLDGPKGTDGVVVMQNNSNEFVDAGMAKNGTLLTVQKNIACAEQADFQLTPNLYFMAASSLQKGDLIRSYQVTEEVFELPLTNLSSVDIAVRTADAYSGRLEWVVSNTVAAS